MEIRGLIEHLEEGMSSKFLFAVIFVVGVVIAAPAQTFDKAKLDQFFDRLAEKNKAMGSLIIAKDGNAVYSRSIGFSAINGTAKKPITPETRFRIGSISKTFTAAMVLQLVDERKLKLADTIDKYFPGVPNAPKITIAHLLGHRSGIRGISEMPEYRPLREKGATPGELLAMLEKAGPSEFEPGSKFSYLNENYLLLGLLIEKVTGKPYQQNLADRITKKIGLKDTYAASGPVDPQRNETFSYRMGRDWEQETEIHWSLFFGAGSIISTPSDLTKFISALYGGKVVSKQSLAAMTTMKDDYGLGIAIDRIGGQVYYGHTGGAQSFGALLSYLPEQKLALAYATNAKPYPVGNIVSGVLDIYWNRPFEIPEFKMFEVSSAVLDRYVGTYSAVGVPISYKFTREGTTLLVQVGTGAPIRLEATAENKFQIDPPGIFFEFDPGKGEVTWRRGQGQKVFTKEK